MNITLSRKGAILSGTIEDSMFGESCVLQFTSYWRKYGLVRPEDVLFFLVTNQSQVGRSDLTPYEQRCLRAQPEFQILLQEAKDELSKQQACNCT